MYAVLSDVHSNLEALRSVLLDIEKRGIDNIYFLGDAVGYGPEPNECMELLTGKCKILLAGNHDRVICGLLDADFFNVYARAAIEWTAKRTRKEWADLLGSFPVITETENEDLTLVHSTPFEPLQWHYLLDIADSEINFQHFRTTLCFVGHSHWPFIIERTPSGDMPFYKNETDMNTGSRYIINAGSIGQPRDHDPRSSYVLVDDKHIEIVRVPYDIETTQYKMAKAGLPVQLINRLSFGI